MKMIQHIKGTQPGKGLIRLIHYLWICLLCMPLCLQSCSDSLSDSTPEEEHQINNYYIALNVFLPSEIDSRSTTKEDGESSNNPSTLPGSSYENTINTAKLYFFDKTNHNQLCYVFAYKQVSIESTNSPGVYTLTAKIEEEEIKQLAGREVNLYVLANISDFSEGKGTTDEDKFLNGTFPIADIGSGYATKFIPGKNGEPCPLSNNDYFTLDLTGIDANVAKSEFRKQLSYLFSDQYLDGVKWDASKNDKVFDDNNNLLYPGNGHLELQRAIARVDIHAGTLSDGNLNRTIYELPGTIMKYDGGSQKVYMKLYSVQLFNVSKQSFLFRHISEGNGSIGKSTKGQIKLFDKENGHNPSSYDNETDETISYNWIYDTDWETKLSTTVASSAMFLNQPTLNGEEWTIEGNKAYNTIEYLIPWLKDNPSASYALPDFIPWFYIPENTLPSTEKMNLAFSTGIYFSFQLCNADGNTLTFKDGAGNDLEAPESVKIIFTEGENKGYYQDIPLTLHQDDYNNNVNSGFYLDYKYLIEHNRVNNGKIGNSTGTAEGTLAPMQIGVVRNNIYSIQVKAVKNLPQPNEPDNGFLTLEIKVLPWSKHTIETVF